MLLTIRIALLSLLTCSTFAFANQPRDPGVPVHCLINSATLQAPATPGSPNQVLAVKMLKVPELKLDAPMVMLEGPTQVLDGEQFYAQVGGYLVAGYLKNHTPDGPVEFSSMEIGRLQRDDDEPNTFSCTIVMGAEEL